MKKSLIAIAALAACAGAQAQDGVQVYGILDVGVGTVQHSLPISDTFPSSVNPLNSGGMSSAYSKRVTGMLNGGMQDSRWGIKGSEDLGGGLKAFFQLESGFNLPTGSLNDARASVLANASSNGGVANSSSNANSSLNGQLFGRQAFVGLSDKNLGSIAFGRNYNFIYDAFSSYDPGLKSDIMSPFGLSGTVGGGGGISENSRVDNSIKYKNQIGAVNFGAMFKLGASNGTAPGSGYALTLGYDEGNFGVQSVYEAFNNVGALGISSGRARVTVYDTEAFLLAAKYKLDKATFKAGWQQYKLKKASDAPVDGFDYFGTATALAPTGTQIGVVGYTDRDQTVNTYFIGGDYNVTEAFNVALGIYDINYQANGTTATAGDIYWYTLIGDYKLSKRTDIYGGVTLIDYQGAKYSTAAYTSNSLMMVGIRHKF